MNSYLEVDQISVLPTLAQFHICGTKLKLRTNQMKGKMQENPSRKELYRYEKSNIYFLIIILHHNPTKMSLNNDLSSVVVC